MKLVPQRITQHTCAFKVPITTCKSSILADMGWGLVVNTPESIRNCQIFPLRFKRASH